MLGVRRNLEEKIEKLLDFFPAVILLGVRQCGKTTLARKIRPNWKYFDLEKGSDYDRISNDTAFFFKENPQGLIIDAAQQYPELFIDNNLPFGVVVNNSEKVAMLTRDIIQIPAVLL